MKQEGRKFHEYWKINVASETPYKEKCPAPGSHVFQPTGIIFDLVQDSIGINLLTEFHEDRTINVASIVKNAPLIGSHVFQAKATIFILIQDIIGTNLLTKFHEDRKINVASRETARPLGGHVFQPTGIIFKFIQDIIGMNLLTKKNAPPIGSHVYIIGTNLLSRFHEDRKINVASREECPAPYGHVFQATGIIFKLVQDIIGMNHLTTFHEDQTINVASRVKNAPTLGSHVFQANVAILKLIQDIIETNLLTKFHEDWTINVASRELTRQMLTAHNGRRTTDKKRSQKLTMSTLCSCELKTLANIFSKP
ncbi:hypothetical protein DPMN_126424 [Dreissena polymorpha]|uniref:Uncharacterized protein n=1 Tax=Dreissena polymorpha TaxID=45954 RepID=A0A9D4JXY3_DREPO|nr:hypothetical protein DPMN_126424 [Dreissena polymorpha]